MPEGKLIFVPTPIGNLGDITLRAIEVLRDADAVGAEDTRKAKILFSKYEISTPLFSFHVRNERTLSEKVLNRVRKGETVAIISEAGTPGISDPGYSLIRLGIAEGLPIEVLPGATALIPAVVLSGFPINGFRFEGFLSHTGKGRRRRLRILAECKPCTLVFYVSPHRFEVFVADALQILGDRNSVLCRELSKLHEETIRARLSKLCEKVGEVRGELVLVIGPE